MSVVKQFRQLVETEGARLQSRCDEWRNILKCSTISDEHSGRICSAIGLSDLLVNEKFKQFSSLIDKCEDGVGLMKITVTDLQGFWDLVKIQVDDIDRKFRDLQLLEQNQWKEDKLKSSTEPKESVLLPVTTNSTKRFRRHHIKDYSSGAAKKRLAKAKANFQSHTDTRLKLDEKENINNLTSRQRNEPGGSSSDLG